MKKSILFRQAPVLVLGLLFFAACTGLLDDAQSLPPENLTFSPEELTSDAAVQGALAGSFSAEGGTGTLRYRLAPGEDSGDNGKFTVTGNQLKIAAASLNAGEYTFRARVTDDNDESAEQSFTLRVAEAKQTPREAADAFATAHAGALGKSVETLAVGDEAAVDAALAAYDALAAEAKALLGDEKALLDSLQAAIAVLKAADAFTTDHAEALAKTEAAVTVSDKAAVSAALAAYDALSAEAKALLGAEKALLDSLKARIDQLMPAAQEAADAFAAAHAGALGKTVDALAVGDEAVITAALAAYEALDADAQTLLGEEKALLDSLKAKIDALKSAAAFTTAHAGALGKSVDAVTAGDEAVITAALAAYEALGADAQTLLGEEKALLDSLKAKIDALKAAAAFTTAHAGALGKSVDAVTAGDEAVVTAALAAYEALGADAQTLLAAEKALLDSLKTRIDALKAAAAFKTAHAGALGKSVDAVTAGDEAGVTAALAAYNALGAEAKVLLAAEKALLDKLKTRIDGLIAASQEAVNAFKTSHAGALGKSIDTVTTGDEAGVTAALTAYNALAADAASLLAAEKALLDSLKTRIDALKEVDAFKTAHDGALGKTVDTVALADEATVDAALAAYEALSAEAKPLLAAEKALLDGLKAKIEAPGAANAFKTTHAGALGKTPETVAVGDEAGVTAALAAYNALSAAARALLTVEKTLLDKLKAKIDALKEINAFKTTHAEALGKTPETVAVGDEAGVNAALAAYEALSAAAKALLTAEKALLDSLKTKIGQLKPQPPARTTGLSSSPRMKAVSLSWNTAARAETYEVYYSTGTSFAGAEKFALEPTETKITITGLEDSTVYNLWVRAKNTGGTGQESSMHTARRTSDPLPAGFLYSGLDVSCFRANGSYTGDYYIFQDLGEDKAPDKRYKFAYGGPFDNPAGIVKFVVQFANPPEEPSVGLNGGAGPGKGTTVYDLPWDINRGVIIYQYGDEGQFQATYWADYQEEYPPKAIMGQANGYTSGLGNDQETDTLDEAIEKFGHIGGPGMERGKGGRYDYWTMMSIYYEFFVD